jgi:MarR family transcriptional regulator for hemolysin
MTAKKRAVRRASRRDGARDRLRVLFREIVFRARSVSRRRLGLFGLTPSQFLALQALMLRDGLAVGELAAELGISPSTASRILDQLETKAFVRRATVRGDRRRIKVFLRPKGKKLRERVRAFWAGMSHEMFQGFSEEDLAALEEGLSRLHKNVLRVEKQEGRP